MKVFVGIIGIIGASFVCMTKGGMVSKSLRTPVGITC